MSTSELIIYGCGALIILFLCNAMGVLPAVCKLLGIG